MTINLWSRWLDLVSPRQCVVCRRRLSVSEQVICGVCNLHLPRTQLHLQPTDNELARLFWGIIPVERATAFFYYQVGAETVAIVHDLKYRHQPEIGPVMGSLMARELLPTGFFDGIDAIVPMPLAPKRQRQRGYNQCELIAAGIAEQTGLPVLAGVVSRQRFVRSQTRLTRWDRQDNVANVFTLADADRVSGLHLLLVDDVVTTGATIAACACELLKAPGVKVSILALSFAKS